MREEQIEQSHCLRPPLLFPCDPSDNLLNKTKKNSQKIKQHVAYMLEKRSLHLKMSLQGRGFKDLQMLKKSCRNTCTCFLRVLNKQRPRTKDSDLPKSSRRAFGFLHTRLFKLLLVNDILDNHRSRRILNPSPDKNLLI